MKPREISESIIRLFNFRLHRRLNGQKLVVPVIHGTKVGISGEKWMSGILKILLKYQPGTFVDIGVNLGQTLAKLKTIDPTRNYIGIEPNPSCVSYVLQLISANRWESATVIPAGVFNESCILPLIAQGETDGGASIIEQVGENREGPQMITKMVTLLSFDKIEQALPEDVAIIKIDVEGAEHQVLKSMTQFITARQPLILLEAWCDHNDPEKVAHSQKVEALIRQLNYEILSWHRLEAAPYFKDLQKARLGEFQTDNYLLVPEDRVDLIIEHFHQ